MDEITIPSKLPDVGTTIFSVMSALAKEEKAINLSQGFPDFSIDPKLKECVNHALKNEQVQYAPMPGRLDLREQLAEKMFVQHGITLNPDNEITITAGATEAIYAAITATVSAGDEVIMFDPAYDCYDPSVRLQGGIPIHLNLNYPDFSINWQEVAEKINNKTKLIVVNNPHNPAGTVWKSEDIKALEEICIKHPNIFIISDEVYEHIQFEGEHQSVLKSEVIRSRSFVTYSFGKTFHVTGWKMGYCVAPEKLTKELRKAHQFIVFCVNNTMQAALTDYLKSGQYWKEVNVMYREKSSLFLEGMQNSKFRALTCEGTYFCLFDYSEISNTSDIEFAKWMTKKHKIASIPVSVFYQDKTDHNLVRFCFAKEDETLLKAIDRLCKI